MAINEIDSSFTRLSALFLKPEVTGLWYNTKQIQLDGFKFVSCRFDKCVLVVTTTNFELVDCHIGDGTTIQFGGEIAKPIRLFNFRNEGAYKDTPFFAPVKNPDGTITIRA